MAMEWQETVTYSEMSGFGDGSVGIPDPCFCTF